MNNFKTESKQWGFRKAIPIIFFALFFICCKKNEFSDYGMIPKTITLNSNQHDNLKIHLKRPTLEKRSTSRIMLYSSSTDIVEIVSFNYNATGYQLMCCPKAIFYKLSLEVKGKNAGQADLIITTEMTVQDTLHQFSDTIHVTVIPEIEN